MKSIRDMGWHWIKEKIMEMCMHPGELRNRKSVVGNYGTDSSENAC
jgi:hypothetical protein